MRSPDVKEWSKRKHRELFTLSNYILDLANSFYEFQMREIRLRSEYALAIANHMVSGRMSEIKEEQMALMTQSVSHAVHFQMNSRSSIEVIQEKIKTNSNEYVHKSVDLLVEFIEEGDRKIPVGAKRVADVVRVAGESGDKAYLVGKKLAHIALQNADNLMEKYLIEEP